jgi:hypothetical protein
MRLDQRDSEPCRLERRSGLRAAPDGVAGAEPSTGSHHRRNTMRTIPITEVVPRISQQLTLLVYELLDAHDDTARPAADLAPDVRWEVHLGYLRDLQRWDARLWHSAQLGTADDDPRCLAEHASAGAGGELRVHVRGL